MHIHIIAWLIAKQGSPGTAVDKIVDLFH